MSANSRHLTLAAEALKSARTRLRNAANRTCMSDATRESAASLAVILELYERDVRLMAYKADAHLAAKVASRRSK